MTVQEYNDLYKRPMVKNVKIESSGGVTITNTNIVSEQMSLEKSLCSESNLRFGRCEAACFKVRIADIDHDFTGEWLNVTQDAKADIEGYLLTQDGKYLYTEDGQRIQVEYKRDIEDLAQLGHFKVYSDKPDNDRRWKNLTCYDRMYDILNADVAAWYNGLTFPMTIKAFRDSFFNYIGVTQKTTTLINDNFVTQGGFSVTGSLSGKTVIESICELNGVFGVMTPDDEFDYVSLANPDTLTLDYYVDGTGSYEDYVTDVITGICAKGSESDIGTSVGTTENVYTIVNNPLINGTEGTAALTTALNNLLQNVLSISFRPFQVTTYGNPMLPLGTRITINTRNQTIISYVINKEMTGVQGLRDKISAKSDKHQSENINSSYDEIYRTKGKVHELKIDVDGLVSRMATTESKLDNDYYTKSQTESKISQTESEIMTTVSNSYVTQASYNAEIQNLQDQIDGRIEYFDGNVVPTLNNPPANSWTTTAAKDSHVGDLYRYHYTDGGVNKTDYYRFDKDTSTTPATYSWVVLGESQVDEALRQAELANQKADAAQQQLDSLQSNVEDNYYTKSATDSKIQQTANSITQSVSSTYETKSDSTSKFNTADANAQGYANTALATANTNAQGYANSAKDAANAATDNKLTSYYTKTQTDSQIAQTANSITSSVSSTYETKSDATAKLNTANSNAQTYANNARDSANASTDNKLQSYYTKSETNSQIQQTANSITQSVSETYTTKSEFNDLEIGATNYLKWTKDITHQGGWSVNVNPNESTGWFIFGISNLSATLTNDGIKYTHANNTNAAGIAIPLSDYNAVIGGEEITYSFEYRTNFTDGGKPFLLVTNQGDTSSNIQYTGNVPLLTASSTVWKKYEATITFPSSSGKVTGAFMPIYFRTGNGWIEIKNGSMKLEKGNRVTNWSPSPYDFYTTKETNTQIQQTANSITSTVAQTYTTKTEFNDLSIGGENYFYRVKDGNSEFYGNNCTNKDYENYTYIFTSTGSDPYIYSTSSTQGTAYSNVYGPLVPVTPNEEVYIKFYDLLSSTNRITKNYICLWDENKKIIQGAIPFLRSEGTYTVPSTSTIRYLSLRFGHGQSSSGTQYKVQVKIEKGNRATDFSPAPADVEAYADSVGVSTLSAANAATDQKLTNYSTKSEVTQLSNQIVMKVDTNGNIVKVALSADPSTGTEFTVGADNIELSASEAISLMAGGTINLTAQNITFSTTGGTFGVSTDGTITAKKGLIGCWKITDTQFYDSVADTTGSNGAGICKYGEGYAFWAGSDFAHRTTAPFRVGHNGNLTATQATITGTVTSANLTATGGSIGGLSIDSSGMYYQRTSSSYSGLTSTEWPFFINATSKTNPKTGAFRVSGIGSTVARDITLTNDSGSVADISNKSKIWINSSTSLGTSLTMYDSSGSLFLNVSTSSSRLRVFGDFAASGTKNRIVDTPDYGERLLYCYETPTPLFGDIGEGKIAEDGKCYIWLDSQFSETVKTESYQVFLQKYGQGECYVTERTSRYFVVEGDPNMKFGWEIKARQAGYENNRLEKNIEPAITSQEYDFPNEAIRHLEAIQNEREVA